MQLAKPSANRRFHCGVPRRSSQKLPSRMILESLETRRLLSVDVAINTATRFQTIDGFGTGTVAWASANDTDAYRNMYYQDLGASIVRVDLSFHALKAPSGDISAPIRLGSDINANIKLFNFDDWTPKALGSFAASSKGKKLDDVKIIGSLWSPPHWMKGEELDPNTYQKNGVMPQISADGYNTGGGSLIDTSDNLQQFGRYVAAYVKGFEQKFGVPLAAISIQNELAFHEWYSSCVYSPELYVKAIKAVYTEFKTNGITTKIEGPEDVGVGSVNDPYVLSRQFKYINAIRADALASEAVGIYAIHGYAGDGVSANRSPEMWGQYWNGRPYKNQYDTGWTGIKNDGKHSWQTETSGEPQTFEGGLSVAQNIQDALTYGNVSAWVYWQTLDNNDSSQFTLTSNADGVSTAKYAAAKHFFRYIRPGAQRVAATPTTPDGVSVSAYIQDAQKTLTAVLVNSGSTAQTIKISALGTSIEDFDVARLTTSTVNWSDLGKVIFSGGYATVTLPAKSILTLEGNTGAPGSTPPVLPAPPAIKPNIVGIPIAFNVAEGGSKTFDVVLSSAPDADTIVTVARSSGDTDLSATSGTKLAFTASNWATAQKVTIAAAVDADQTNGSAVFRLSAAGLSDFDVTVTEEDTTVATPPPVTNGAATYVSDLPPTYSVNGYGGFEKDKSNGEQFTGDGKTLTLSGKTYAKGLGVHGYSELRYDLAGKYSNFLVDVGIDDEVGNSGSVTFQVYADGALLFDSGVMNGASTTKGVNVAVAGRKELKLIVIGGVDGIAFDHADWADARLLAGSIALPASDPVAPPAGPAAPAAKSPVNASGLAFVSSNNAWGTLEKDRSNGEKGASDGKTIKLNGVSYARGFGTHAGSEIVLNVPAGYTHFKSDIGIDDEVGIGGSVIFKVFSGAKLLYTSAKLTGASTTVALDVNLTGYTQVKLVADTAGDGNTSDHADWAGARFE